MRISGGTSTGISNGKERGDEPTPVDAREPTEAQRIRQQQLDHQHDDPDAPGAELDRHHVADET